MTVINQTDALQLKFYWQLQCWRRW